MSRKHAAALVLLVLPVVAWAAFRRDPDPAGFVVSDPVPAAIDAAPSFLESIGLEVMRLTRGERNNNPGNLRPGSKWIGLRSEQSDPGFLQFEDATAGIRALAVLLRTYQARYGLATVREIINRYAPASENDTSAYVRAVAAAIGAGPDDPLDLSDRAVLTALVRAIIHHENGRIVYSDAEINEGVSRA